MTSFSSSETRAVSMLATLYVVRMLGLFMVLPLIAIYSADLAGATPFLLGLAVGAYGLTQASLQIPMGWLSDRIDRRLVIVLGLSMLTLGSVVAAMSSTIWGVIFGRFLQGAGAIASATMALVADYTREEQRAKASAIIGGSIAIAFGIALVLGSCARKFRWPAIGVCSNRNASLDGRGCCFFLPKPQRFDREKQPDGSGFQGSRLSQVLSIPSLNLMYLFIFFLHLTLMAVFVVVPTSLEIEAGIALEQHAWVYLGALVFSVPGIYWLVQGRRYMNKPIANLMQCLGVLLLGVLLLSAGDWAPTLAGLCLFFTGFTALEAMLPSLASIYAPASARGTAMGVFASSQFIGVFVGGLMGGALLDTVGAIGVWAGMAALALVWAVILGLSRLASPETATA